MVCPDLLFSQVHLDIASQWGNLSSQQRRASDHLLASLLKKWSPDDRCTPEQERIALAKFLQANEQCRNWHFAPSDMRDEELLLLFQEEWNGFLGYNKKTGAAVIADPVDLSPIRAIDYGRVGPGASAGIRNLSFYGKMFAGPMTSYDEDLYQWYRAAISEDPRWTEAEKLRLQQFGTPRVVAGNKLSYVPKNVEVARTICSEASLNMFVQLGQGTILENRLKTYYGLSIRGGKDSVQHIKNQELARLGSIDGSFATIDLSSASDSISLNMLRRFTPREAMWALERTRASYVQLPGGKLEELFMVSSMGNGYTFPLETALFASIVVAASRFNGLKLDHPWGVNLGNWAVFGDDIIVPRQIFSQTVRLLELLGFKVNESKTFADGWFRESCGADWYKGYPVRGVYLTSLSTIEKRFVAYNLLHEWARKHKVTLDGALKLIVSSIPRGKRSRVPLWEGPERGLRQAEPPCPPKKHVFKTGSTREKREFFGWIYEVQEEVGRKVDVGSDGNWKIPDLFYNPAALFLCVEGGYIRDGYLHLSSIGNSRWRTGQRMTVNWDLPPMEDPKTCLPRVRGKSDLENRLFLNWILRNR